MIVSLFQIIHELNSRHLEPVEMFLGVPYAAPPGRLQPPAPPARWNGTRLADSLPPVCPQRYPDISNVTAALRLMPKDRYLQLRRLIPLLANQSEDCLRLNIYVPASGKYPTIPPPSKSLWTGTSNESYTNQNRSWPIRTMSAPKHERFNIIIHVFWHRCANKS